MTTTAVATASGLCKSYGEIQALQDVSVQIESGKILAVLGPNGAGKTTLINCLLGLIKPDQGSLDILSGNPQDNAVRRHIGAMLQISGVPDTLTVGELVQGFSAYYAAPRPIQETLALADITDLEHRRYGKLSGGQQQRVLFALAICGNPRLLYLDEPTVGLDVSVRRHFWRTINTLKKSGTAIVVTTHYLEEADQLADQIMVLRAGSVVACGSPEDIKNITRQRWISCRTKLALDQIQAITGVQIVERKEGVAQITCQHAAPVLRALLQQDSELCDIQVRGAQLEDAFLSLTQSSQQEKAA